MKKPEKDFYGRLGAWIKAARLKAGISLSKLGQQVDVSYMGISKYENGTVRTPIKTYIEICEFLEVDWVKGVVSAIKTKKGAK